uniref:Uncharacterized protein n=1 Tax=Anguilla anguilla TaxID=7936 RepID=A0A0E9TWN3_ANGAN
MPEVYTRDLVHTKASG